MTGRSNRTIRSSSCKVCSHPDRARLELLRVSGVSFEALATEFKTSKDSIFRHFRAHVSERRKAELLAGPAKIHDLANAAAKESKSLLEYLQITRGVLFNSFLAAAECGDRGGVVNTSTQLLAALRELGKLTGELRNLSAISVTTNNILNIVATPEFERLSTGLLDLARRHPDAKADVIALLRSLETETPGPNGSRYGAGPIMIEADAIEELEAADAH
jgi:hypothetical protein